jgi:lipid-A-disaccharide synthase
MSRILVLFPFELEVWRAAGADAVWVGHPMLDALPAGDPPTPERGTLALLPGSRRSEITRLFPTMLAAAARLAAEGRVARVVVPVAPGLDPAWLARLADGFVVPITWVEAADVAGRFREVRRAEAAIVASGTATLETALAGVPHVLTYRVSPVSWWIGRRLARVRFLGLSNLLLGRQVIPELLQAECAPEPIAQAVRGLLDAPEAQRRALVEVRAALGAGGAAERAAEAILALVGR